VGTIEQGTVYDTLVGLLVQGGNRQNDRQLGRASIAKGDAYSLGQGVEDVSRQKI
jgi:hypothetical protein